MNFETTFDFATAEMFLQKQLNAYQTQISSVDQEASQLSQCNGFAHITGDRLKSLAQRKKAISPKIEEITKTLSSIEEMRYLDQNEKDMLFILFTLTKEDASQFMSKMLGNYKKILADSDVLNLLRDQNNSSEIKTLLAQHILGKYPVTTIIPIIHNHAIYKKKALIK